MKKTNAHPTVTPAEKVRALPAPTPGLVITVPLDTWPLYMATHNLAPAGYRHPILLVKKVDDGNEHKG